MARTFDLEVARIISIANHDINDLTVALLAVLAWPIHKVDQLSI